MPLLFCLLTVNGRTQTFEVASVKLADPNLGERLFPVRGGPGTSDPARVEYSNISLRAMLYYAYGVAGNEISAPPWLAMNKFDITAKIPPGTTKPQFAVMLQNLLADRFHLVVHREQKEVNGYAMVIGKNGPKLTRASAEDTAAATQPPSGPAVSGVDEKGYMKLARPGMIYPFLQGSNGKAIHLIARAQLLSDLGRILTGFVRGPVEDSTGLSGRYDFTLDFSTDSSAAPDVLDTAAPDVPTALQEQLGLKLEPKKTQLDVLVVDSADKIPTGN